MSDGQKATRPRGTIYLGKIGDSDVLVSSSWFLVALLIAVAVAPRVDLVQPGLGVWKYVVGALIAILLYLSVLMHEASHALMARHYGYRVPTITLHFLGGMTAIEGEARTPKQEFMIAVVGPLTSLAIGVAAWGLWFITPGGLLLLAVEGLIGANVFVGVLNLVPGLPLDGGRVLKSAVWGLTGNAHRGTIVAGWAGRVVAIAVLAWPFAQPLLFAVPFSTYDAVLCAIIALFLWGGAGAAITSATLRRKLPSLVARPLARRALGVPEDLPLGEAVRRTREAEAGSIVTVAGDGRPLGVVSESALQATPEDRWPWLAVSVVARTVEDGLILSADLAGEDLVRAMQHTPASEYLLVEADGRLCGVLVTEDVDRAFREAR